MMLLLALVIAPLGVALLFLIMPWAERALDHELDCQVPATTDLGDALADGRPTPKPFVLIDQVVGR